MTAQHILTNATVPVGSKDGRRHVSPGGGHGRCPGQVQLGDRPTAAYQVGHCKLMALNCELITDHSGIMEGKSLLMI